MAAVWVIEMLNNELIYSRQLQRYCFTLTETGWKFISVAVYEYLCILLKSPLQAEINLSVSHSLTVIFDLVLG